MAITFTPEQIALGKAMGLSSISSQNDLNQINAFALKHGVKNLDSQKDLNQLLSYVTPLSPTATTNPNDFRTPDQVIADPQNSNWPYAPGRPNPNAILGTLPGAAADGSGDSDFQALLMQQQQQLAQQNAQFELVQKQFVEQQAAMTKAMQDQLLQASTATTPAPVVGAGKVTTGGTYITNPSGIASLESLLIGTQTQSQIKDPKNPFANLVIA